MIKKLLFSVFIAVTSVSYGQGLLCKNVLDILGATEKKQELFYQKKGFLLKDKFQLSDTLIKIYEWDRRGGNKKSGDSVFRRIIRKSFGGTSLINYQTAAAEECSAFKNELQQEGFYFFYDKEKVTDTTPLLYQYHNITAYFSVSTTDSLRLYSFQFLEKSFPDPATMYYADDLLHFTSHEYLVYFFGEENVKKDVCYFSDNQIATCSVLFLNTNRQVVFLWQDELNRCTISSLLIGGQQKLKSQQDYDKYIAENNWLLKSGIHAGMSLYELRLLHGADIRFYGGNAVNTGEVLATNEGKLNFKKENVILGCMNCRDNKFAAASVVSADEALKDGRILFVLSIIVRPDVF